jgi:secretion/DNA translocation related TadE-like protein
MTVRSRRDDGSASIIAVAVGLVTVLLAATFANAGAAIVAHHRAQVAADLSALAGAAHAIDGPSVACTSAATEANANGAHMLHCGLDGWDVIVSVEVRPLGPAAAFGSASASARAGPA